MIEQRQDKRICYECLQHHSCHLSYIEMLNIAIRRLVSMHTIIHSHFRAGRSGPAALVLAGPVFLKVKIKFNFYKKNVISNSAWVIFGLVRLIILNYNRQQKHIKRCMCTIISHSHLIHYYAHKVLFRCAKS